VNIYFTTATRLWVPFSVTPLRHIAYPKMYGTIEDDFSLLWRPQWTVEHSYRKWVVRTHHQAPSVAIPQTAWENGSLVVQQAFETFNVQIKEPHGR